MLVADVMQAAVLTITPKTSLPEAMRLMQHGSIRHLPVVEHDQLVGIVSDRDLKRAMAWPATSLEVHDRGRLVGIVTETDVLELFVRGMGARQPSSRIDVRLPEDSATVADLVHAVEDASVAISSLMTLTDRSGHKDVVIRVRSIDPRAAVANLETRGYAVRDPRNG